MRATLRAINADIKEHGLDPAQPHSHMENGHLVAAPVKPVTIEPLAEVPATPDVTRDVQLNVEPVNEVQANVETLVQTDKVAQEHVSQVEEQPTEIVVVASSKKYKKAKPVDPIS